MARRAAFFFVCCLSYLNSPDFSVISSRQVLRGPGGVLPNGELRDVYDMEPSTEAREGPLQLFASPIYRRRIRREEDAVRELNEEIAVNFKRLMVRDEKGVEWSKTDYAGGYTSYFSLPALQKWVPPIQTLEQWLKPHIEEFRKEAGLLEEPELFMTDCWANVMGEGTEHCFHQHNRSTISGTYYVQTPRGCSSLLFEDPRLDRHAVWSLPIWVCLSLANPFLVGFRETPWDTPRRTTILRVP